MILCAVSGQGSELVATRVEDGPSVDGRLDDPAWTETSPVRCLLTQYDPDHGMPMTEETEISIVYDDGCIYFGFRMDDPDPSSMMEALTPRDDYVTGEWIAVLLDTWGDGREASSFEISLANSQMDSKISPGGNWDYSWDAVWQSGTCHTGEGWSAEIAIPFSCLRFDPSGGTQAWSVNFQRILGRTHENGWYVLSTSRQMAQLETFAPILGITGISRSLGAELRPYGSSRFLRDEAADAWDSDLDAGLDAKLGITSGIAADLTVHPDFGQVESDAAEMNLSHFELFLDERRPFFLESQSVFRMPFDMFYSRRIGAVAPNGEVIPILSGAKLSGSLGDGFRFGFLDAVTEAVSEDTATILPAANYAALRTVKEFGPFDYLGISAVSRDSWRQDGFEEEANRAFAVDGGLLVPGDHLVEAAAAGSMNTGRPDDGACLLSVSRVRSTLTYAAGWQYVGEDFDVNGTGFTTETGCWNGWAEVHDTVMPEETFSRVGFGSTVYYSERTGGEATGRGVSLEGSAALKNGAYLGLEVDHSGETFDPYEGPDGCWYGSRTGVHGYAGTNQFDDYYVSGNAGVGQYDHEGTFLNGGLTVRMKPHQALDLRVSGDWYTTEGTENYNWASAEWDTRSTDWRSLIVRAGYMFGPDLNLRLFSQYSRFAMDWGLTGETESAEITANLLMSWQYLPGSMFYLLVENGFAREEGGGFGDPDPGLYAKLTWFLPV